jgi:hypothetical protein
MDSSTPTPADPPSPVVPRREVLGTVAAQVAAIDELIGLARLSVKAFDVDLSQMGWTSPERAERLARFLRASPLARLEIILHDTRYYESHCARLQALQRRYGGAVAIYRTGAEAQSAMDPLLLVDDRHYLHRFHVDQPRAALGIEQPHGAKPLANRYAEIWATGEPGLSGTVLGL